MIQTITAVDKDDFANGQRFSFALPAHLPVNPNFTLKDNEGTSASPLGFDPYLPAEATASSLRAGL